MSELTTNQRTIIRIMSGYGTSARGAKRSFGDRCLHKDNFESCVRSVLRLNAVFFGRSRHRPRSFRGELFQSRLVLSAQAWFAFNLSDQRCAERSPICARDTAYRLCLYARFCRDTVVNIAPLPRTLPILAHPPCLSPP